MLTKNDLSQIRKVIRQEVKVEIKDSTQTLGSQIRISRMQIQANIGELDDRMKNVEIRLDDVGSQVKKTQKDVSQIKRTQDRCSTYSIKNKWNNEKELLDLKNTSAFQVLSKN